MSTIGLLHQSPHSKDYMHVCCHAKPKYLFTLRVKESSATSALAHSHIHVDLQSIVRNHLCGH